MCDTQSKGQHEWHVSYRVAIQDLRYLDLQSIDSAIDDLQSFGIWVS
jgi:hypothetical protein